MVPKPCIEAGCPEPALPGKARCRTHHRVNEARRRADPTLTGRRGTSSRWAHLRRTVLAHQPFCPCGAVAAQVHHVDGDATNDALDNLQALCADCHRDRHRA